MKKLRKIPANLTDLILRDQASTYRTCVIKSDGFTETFETGDMTTFGQCGFDHIRETDRAIFEIIFFHFLNQFRD